MESKVTEINATEKVLIGNGTGICKAIGERRY
jgi:hypothetical protein